MRVYIIGTGMDGVNSLTKEAEKAIEKAELLIGAERLVKPFMESGRQVFISYKPDEISHELTECGYDTAAVLMSGDCGFFSGARKLLPYLGIQDVRVIPGISSLSYLCSKAGLSYEKMKFISLHGRDSNIVINVKMNEYCFFLLGGEMTAADVCRKLCSYGLGAVTVHIGSELGLPDEHIYSGKAEDFCDIEVSGLSVMITDNWEYLSNIPSCISDGSFIRREVPMTKSEVRCIAVAKLGICSDSVVWDIGCGTGSVSVESAFRCPDGRVYAFDKNSEGVQLTEDNAHLFGCDNIIVTEGKCPEMLENAPAPDCVFIGGSSGDLAGLFSAIYEKNMKAQIVITAVSLETVHEASVYFKKYGLEPEAVQISVSRGEKLLGHTMMRAQNPVFIISGRLS